MNATFKHLFFLRLGKKKPDGRFPIYQRITIDGIARELSTNRTAGLSTFRKYTCLISCSTFDTVKYAVVQSGY